jgi:hypothetical protein
VITAGGAKGTKSKRKTKKKLIFFFIFLCIYLFIYFHLGSIVAPYSSFVQTSGDAMGYVIAYNILHVEEIHKPACMLNAKSCLCCAVCSFIPVCSFVCLFFYVFV